MRIDKKVIERAAINSDILNFNPEVQQSYLIVPNELLNREHLKTRQIKKNRRFENINNSII